MLRWLLAGCCPLLGCLSQDVSLSATDGQTDSEGTTSTSTASDTDLPSSDDTSFPSECDAVPMRVMTYNIESVGFANPTEFQATLAVLGRVDADVVCLQEVLDFEGSQFEELAEQAGYEFYEQADQSPAIGGELTNGCMSKMPMELVGSFTASDLSPDTAANDVGRDILAVRAEPAPGCHVGLFTVHLKSGGDYADLFRRQVEVERLVQAIALYRETRAQDGLVVLGDFNEQTDESDLDQSLTTVPADLPSSYQLGSDIELPLRYNPFSRLSDQGFVTADATWEDSSEDSTWMDVTRLDYIMLGQAMLGEAEVYNACQDNGVDDAPPGDWIPKSGDALDCALSTAASDHLPVVADIVLP